jgi:hypothetical protein
MPKRGRNRDKRVAVEFKTGRAKTSQYYLEDLGKDAEPISANQYGATPPSVVDRIVELGRVLDEANVPPGDRYVPLPTPVTGARVFMNEAMEISQEQMDAAADVFRPTVDLGFGRVGPAPVFDDDQDVEANAPRLHLDTMWRPE